MALTKLISNLPTQIEERTWRATIETPKGGAYSIQVYRQTSQLDANGNAVSTDVSTLAITRRMTEIVDESVTLPDGTVVPAALILAALPLFFDNWAVEDGRKTN